MDPENTNDKAPESGSSISSDLIRGHINTIILRTLYDGDKYGYEIIHEIEEKSKGQYSLKQPTLYSALKRLESQDYVTSYWGGSSNGGRRKYFQITDKGRQVVEQNLAEWEYSRTVIDSLISEKDYDFNNPPPSRSVDFSLLKKSTTRVPMAHGGEEEEIELPEGFGADDFSGEQADSATPAQPAPDEDNEVLAENAAADEEQTAPEPADNQAKEEDSTSETYTVPQPTPEEQAAASAASTASISAPFDAYDPAQTEDQSFQQQSSRQADATQQPLPEQPIDESAQAAPETAQDVPEEPRPLTEEEKKRIHENYKVLIGDDTDATSYYYSQVARRDRDERTTYDKEVFDDRAEDYAEPAYQEAPYEQAQQAAYPPQDYPPYPQQPQEAYSDEYQSSRQISSELLYSSKPAAERNYKELISRLYDRRSAEAQAAADPVEQETAIPQQAPHSTEQEADTPYTEEQPSAVHAQEQEQERFERAQPIRARAASNIEFYDVEEKAESDGLRITTTNGSRNRTVSKTVGNTFDKGRALFFAAVIVFAIALAESIINICLQRALLTSVAYVVLPFVIDFVMLGIFLFLFLSGYGKNSRKTQSRTYISASLVIFANLVLIICLVAYFIIAFSEQEVSIGIQIVKYGLFPTIYAFNIPLFAIFYRYQSNRQ